MFEAEILSLACPALPAREGTRPLERQHSHYKCRQRLLYWISSARDSLAPVPQIAYSSMTR
jgi:hypothetical protein